MTFALASGPATTAPAGQRLRTVHLYGELREAFRASYRLAVGTPAEAVRALCAMVPGFKRMIMEGHFRCIAGRKDRPRHVTNDTVQMPWRSGEDDLHLVPVIEGRSKGSLTKIIAGLAIIAVAIAAPYALGIAGSGVFGFAAVGTGIGSITFGQIAMVGLISVLGGIAQSISPQANGTTQENQSFLDTSIHNTVQQGNPVPLMYGDCLVGSQNISTGIQPYDVTPGSAGNPLDPKNTNTWQPFGVSA